MSSLVVSNTRRAAWANTALEAFRQETSTDAEDAVADLLCDLMHYCDSNGLEFQVELGRAESYYADEVEDDV